MYVRKSDLFVGTAIILYIVFFALSPPSVVRTVLSNPAGMAACFGVAVYTALYHSRAIGALLIVALLASMTKVSEQFAAGGCASDAVQTSTLVNGGDLSTINDVANAGACGTACCGNASCTGYTYNSQNKNCHLKSGTITTAPGSANFSGAKVTRTAAGTPTLIPGTAGRTLALINKDIDDLKKFGITETSDNEAMKKLLAERATFQMSDIPESSTPPAASPPTSPPPAAAAPPKPVMSCNIENFASY